VWGFTSFNLVILCTPNPTVNVRFTVRGLGGLAGIRTWGAVMESGLQSGSKAIVQNTARSRQPVEVSESTLRQLGDARATTAKGTAIAQDLQQGAMEVTDHVAHSLTGLMQGESTITRARPSHRTCSRAPWR
jgi:hypothetical protein